MSTAVNQIRACRVILSKMFLADETQSSERLPSQIRLWTYDGCWVDGAVSNLKHVHLRVLRASSHSARGFLCFVVLYLVTALFRNCKHAHHWCIFFGIIHSELGMTSQSG